MENYKQRKKNTSEFYRGRIKRVFGSKKNQFVGNKNNCENFKRIVCRNYFDLLRSYRNKIRKHLGYNEGVEGRIQKENYTNTKHNGKDNI